LQLASALIFQAHRVLEFDIEKIFGGAAVKRYDS